MNLYLARVGDGNVVVPSEMADSFGLRPGDALLFQRTGPREGRFVVLKGVRDLDRFWEEHRVDEPLPDDLWEKVAEAIADDAMPTAPGPGTSSLAFTSGADSPDTREEG